QRTRLEVLEDLTGHEQPHTRHSQGHVVELPARCQRLAGARWPYGQHLRVGRRVEGGARALWRIPRRLDGRLWRNRSNHQASARLAGMNMRLSASCGTPTTSCRRTVMLTSCFSVNSW